MPWDFRCRQLNQHNRLKLDGWQVENVLLLCAALSCLVSMEQNAALC